MTYGLHGAFTTRPETRDELVGILLQAAELLGRDPGCIQYLVSTSGDPGVVWVHEIWSDQEAHAASLVPKDVRELIERARPLITGMSDRIELTVHGGKGLPQ